VPPISSLPLKQTDRRADQADMSRVLLLPCLLAAVAAAVAPPAALGKPSRSWAEPQIEIVLAHGLMAPDRGSFDPAAILTQGELAELLPQLDAWLPLPEESDGSGEPEAVPDPSAAPAPTDPSAPVTVAQLDRALVDALGLADAAARFQRALREAGLKPPARLGSEAVARLLGLRINHPAAQDRLELAPSDPITHAEVAYSLARILALAAPELEAIDTESQQFTAPALDAWQRRVLDVAVSFIGYPYVWGGTRDRPQILFGRQEPGGFDCSGFVWRVFKLQRYPGGARLAGVLRGRTTMQLAAEAPRARRIAGDSIEPADILFFGSKGPSSQPRQIDHAAIALGNGWLIQSSRQGVALAPLSGWYADRLAWARRPLAEAGLVPAAAGADPASAPTAG
jgi:cell wall-associated NlpC family hydrolase